MPHDTSFLTRETIHFIPDIHKPQDAALCGLRLTWGHDDPKKVTCPMCIEKLKEKGITK
jgi:hypothetical protein